jgi:hypothetical protein
VIHPLISSSGIRSFQRSFLERFPSHCIWDGEDHVWSYRPTSYVQAEESEQFEAELEIQYDLDKEDVFEVSCTIEKTFRVTVSPRITSSSENCSQNLSKK